MEERYLNRQEEQRVLGKWPKPTTREILKAT
jgi:hypothetical protein